MKRDLPLKTASTGLIGALAIAGGTQAYADVIAVVPPPDPTIPLGTNTTGAYNANYAGDIAWDVDGNGTNDFFFRLRYPGEPEGNGIEWQNNFNPFTGLAATNGIVSYQGAFVRYGMALQPGALIGAASPFSTVGQVVLGSRYWSGGSPNYYGGFAAGPGGPNNAVAPGTVAYAGFRFSGPDGTHYGYIQLSVSAGRMDFVSAAYESAPNTAITAGATAVPEPSTLAMLAVGAVGALGTVIKRRRKG